MSDSIDSLEEGLAAFTEAFQRPPVWCAAAPGRVNLIGEHVDYNDGFVLPAAIDRRVVMLAAPQQRPEICLKSAAYPGLEVNLPLQGPLRPEDGDWANYPKGVLAGYLERGFALDHGLCVWITTDIPVGGGLSSSAALEVAFATLLEEVSGQQLPTKEKARLCQRAEQVFAGVPCGIMDQFASALSREDHLLLIDCQSEEVRWVPFSNPDIVILIANTNVRHTLSSGEYARRRETCSDALRLLDKPSWRQVTLEDVIASRESLGDLRFRRARHVVTETARTLEAVQHLENGRWEAFGELMFASHASLKNDFEVSCVELDAVITAARDLRGEGVIGARMTGGGFGGCTVSLVQAEAIPHVLAAYDKHYRKVTGGRLSLFLTKPSAGAGPLPLPSPRRGNTSP